MLFIHAAVTIAVLTMLPQSNGFISCQAACRKCQQELDVMKLVEVYCAMCRECQLRRQQQRRNMDKDEGVGSMEPEGPREETNNEPEAPDTLEHDDDMVLDERPVIPIDHTANGAHTYHTPLQRKPNNGADGGQQQQPPNKQQQQPHQYIDTGPKQHHQYIDVTQQQNNRPHQYIEQFYTATYNEFEIPEGCPIPPYCDELDEEEIIIKLKSTMTPATTPTTTTKKPCPPFKCRYRKKPNQDLSRLNMLIEWLIKQKTSVNQACPMAMSMACPIMPAPMACPLPPGCNPFPSSQQTQQPVPTPPTNTQPPATTETTTQSPSPATTTQKPEAFMRTENPSDFMYLYVGIPKDGIKS